MTYQAHVTTPIPSMRKKRVSDGSATNNAAVQMAAVLGDTTSDGVVNSGDTAQTKSQSGAALSSANFREDLTVDASFNSGDIALVKSNQARVSKLFFQAKRKMF